MRSDMQPPKNGSPDQQTPAKNSKLEPVKFKPMRFYLIGAVAILLLILFLVGLLPRISRWHEINSIAEEHKLPSVNVLDAKPEKKPIALVLPSTTNAIRYTPIWARVDGYLENFFVDIGDHVQEGQLLATIDTPEIDKQLLQGRADLANAIAQLEIASISSRRWNDLYQRNPQAVPKQEVDERNATLLSSQASVKAYQANVQRLEKLQGFKHIIAPFSGIITQRDIDIGSLITAGSSGNNTGNPQQLFFLAKIDIIRVFVNVPQFYCRLIKNGLTADITIDEFPERVFKGYVARTAGSLDPVARTMLTEVHIDNHDGTLTTGYYANVAFSLVPTMDYFIVPTNSVIIINDGPKIAIVDNKNIIRMVPVTLGRDYGKTMEITTGIKENDRVVVNPDERIKEGVEVQIHQVIPQPSTM